MLQQPTSSRILTLRAQLIRSSSLVITYSPLLLATDAGLAAATAVLFSLFGTKLQQKGEACAESLPCVCSSFWYLHKSISGKLTLCRYSHF